MRRIAVGLFVAVFIAGAGIQLAFCDSKDVNVAGITAANELLEVMKVEASLNEMMNNQIDMQIKQQPSMAPYRKTFMAFLSKYMSWGSMKDDLAAIYAEAFTVGELKDLTVFYKSPSGQKAVRLIPQLSAKGAALGSRRVQDHMQELQEMIAAEAERITNTNP